LKRWLRLSLFSQIYLSALTLRLVKLHLPFQERRSFDQHLSVFSSITFFKSSDKILHKKSPLAPAQIMITSNIFYYYKLKKTFSIAWKIASPK
jgi:hypothetical protein